VSSNADIVWRGYELFNSGDDQGAVGGMDPEIEWRVLDGLPEGGTIFRGPEAVLGFWQRWREVFDDFQAVPDELVEAGDKVVAVVSIRGRGKESGIDVTTPSFAQVWTLRDGKAVRVEMLPSREEALELAGLPFTPGS
jgi:ketosteroid isomerase-like protein